ncbi:peptidoglycan-binding domain-containing protein [Streptomyces sp. NPDC004324]
MLAHRAPTTAASVSQAGSYTCDYTRHGDQLFAGNSTTTSHVVMRNNTGPDAAEVQCLLLRHKLSPGDIHGYYREQTEAQIEHLQRQNHVPADGIVGEQTWTLLRHVPRPTAAGPRGGQRAIGGTGPGAISPYNSPNQGGISSPPCAS